MLEKNFAIFYNFATIFQNCVELLAIKNFLDYNILVYFEKYFRGFLYEGMETYCSLTTQRDYF